MRKNETGSGEERLRGEVEKAGKILREPHYIPRLVSTSGTQFESYFIIAVLSHIYKITKVL